MLPLGDQEKVIRAKKVTADFCDGEMLCFCAFTDGVKYVATSRSHEPDTTDAPYFEIDEQTKNFSGLPLSVEVFPNSIKFKLSQDQAKKIKETAILTIDLTDVDENNRGLAVKCIKFIFSEVVTE